MNCHRCGKKVKKPHYLSLGFHGSAIVLCDECFSELQKFLDEILRPPKKNNNLSVTWSIPKFILEIRD